MIEDLKKENQDTSENKVLEKIQEKLLDKVKDNLTLQNHLDVYYSRIIQNNQLSNQINDKVA